MSSVRGAKKGLSVPEEVKELVKGRALVSGPKKEQRRRLRVAARAVVTQYDEHQMWDKVQAKDVDPRVIEFVATCLERGKGSRQIRYALGIRTESDKRWKKIIAAVRQGLRVNAPALLKVWVERNELLQQDLYRLIRQRIELLGQGFDADDAKAVSSLVTNITQLQQATSRVGKEMGVYEENVGQSGGVTIVVQSNIKMPSQKEVDAHHRKVIEVAKDQSKIKVP